MKRSPLYLLALVVVVFACNEEEDTSVAQQLQGDWDVTALMIDGSDYKAASPASELDFGKYDGSEGDFEFVLAYNNGVTNRLTGKYELNSAQNEIELNYTNGTKQEYTITIDQDKLTLEADITGTSSFPGGNITYRHVIKADRE